MDSLHVDSGVARPQATGALAWGVEANSFVTVAFCTLFNTVLYCSNVVGLGLTTWLATLLHVEIDNRK
jgi:hypothetical protein